MTNSQEESKKRVSRNYNRRLITGKIDQQEEAYHCAVNPSSVSNWANENRAQYNLPVWALYHSDVGLGILEDIAFDFHKQLIDIPTNLNGKTDDERKAVLEAMGKMQTCEDAKCELKLWKIIAKQSEQAIQELKNK